MRKPDIPRVLASRIRKAQDKLANCLSDYAWIEHRITELEAKLAAFERDPDGWARANYPRHDKDSYPVQAHIFRARESLARNKSRPPTAMQELHEAQEDLARVEREVLETVESMRMTKGRVPWPERTLSAEHAVRDLQHELLSSMAQADEERRQREARYAREDARERAVREAEDNAAIRAHVVRGPEHILRHFSVSRAVGEAFQAFKETGHSQAAMSGNWAGSLIEFVSSSMAADAGSQGRRIAEEEIARARDIGEDLWDTCRRLGFHTPDSVAALDRGERVRL